MSELRKANTGYPYFITLTVVEWVDVFTRKEYKDIIIENLKYCQQNEGLRVYAYVIMSNHVHLVVSREHEKPLGELLGRFKSNSSKKIITAIQDNINESRKDWMLSVFRQSAEKNNQYKDWHFWQYTSHPTELDYNEIIDQKIEYIHQNPVVAGIVAESHHYVYSSANPNSELKVDEV